MVVTGQVCRTLPLEENRKTTGICIYPEAIDRKKHTAEVKIEAEVANETDDYASIYFSDSDEARVDLALARPAIWRGGFNAAQRDTTNHLFLDTACSVNRVAVRSALTPGTITVTATARRPHPWRGRPGAKLVPRAAFWYYEHGC